MKSLILIIFWTQTLLANNQVISELTQINIDYIESKLNTKNAEVDKDTAIYQYFPTISLFASTFESDASFGFATDQIRSQGVTARWEIFNFFQDLYAYNAAKNSLKSNEALQRAMKLAAEKSSFEVYLNFLNNYEQYLVKKEITQTLDESSKVAKRKFSRGETSGSESSKIIIQALNTKNESEKFLATSEFYRQRILQLLKRENMDSSWPMSDEKIINLVPKFLKEKVDLAKNPTLEKFRLEKDAINDTITSQKLRHLGGVSLNYRKQKSNLDNFDEWETQLTLTYTFPLFANNTIHSDVVKAKNNKRLIETKLIQEKAKLRALKKSQKVSVRINFENFRRQQQASVLANKVYKQELKRFQRGLVSVNDLLFEQQRQSQAQLGFISAKKDLILSLVDYCHLQGLSFSTCQ